ncbi:MAG: PEGA domain-containing protein [Bacteroidetes bacterium]|nr:PEGA domain-containing protein [Bacteroidota bacterium]
MKKLLFLSLLLLPALLFSQTLREFDLQEMSEQQIPVFVDHPNEAALVIYTAINGFTIESNTAGIVKIESEATKVTVFLKPERQILTLKAPGFIEKKLSMENLSAKQTKFYRLNGSEDVYQPENGYAKINTDPAGCQLLITGIPGFKEKTPFELSGFEAKKYRITLTKPEYFPLDTLIEIKAGLRQNLMFRLKSKFATLSLKTPEQVTVKISGNGELIVGPVYVPKKLPIGTYTIEVSDPRFEPFTKEIKLESGATEIIDLPLVKKTGFLQINHQDQFTIKVNGESYIKNSDPFLIEFLEGSYISTVKRSGYKPVTFNFDIKKGGVISWAPDFLPEMATVKINSNPEGAEVTLVRGGKEKFLGFTPVQEQIQIGAFQLLIKKEGFLDQNVTGVLKDGELIDRTIRLVPVEQVEEKSNILAESGEPLSQPRHLFYGAWINTWFATPEFIALEEEGTISRSPLGFGLGYRQYLGVTESWIFDAQVFFSQSVKTTFNSPTDQLYLGGLSLGFGWNPFTFGYLKPTLLAGYSLVNFGQNAFAFPTGEYLITHQGFVGLGFDLMFEHIVLGTEFRRSVFASGGRNTNQIQFRAGYGL